MIFLVVINLSALISFLLLFSNNRTLSDQNPKGNTEKAFCEELSLTPVQSEKVGVIMNDYRNVNAPVTANIRDLRGKLLGEVAKDNPDTNILNSCTEEICQLQKKLQKASIAQYMALKGVCTPEQCQRLSSLYFELYGCQGKCKEMGQGQGKGKMHRYGKGQGGRQCGEDSCKK